MDNILHSPAPLLATVEKLGFEEPSAIQPLAIPPTLEGKDLVGLSETGSGKTAAFVLPVPAKIDLEQRQPQVLILCPTRELAVQVCEDVHHLGVNLAGLHAVPVCGGAHIDRQLRALRNGAHIIVGTQGRLLDHHRRKSFDPSMIKLAKPKAETERLAIIQRARAASVKTRKRGPPT